MAVSTKAEQSFTDEVRAFFESTGRPRRRDAGSEQAGTRRVSLFKSRDEELSDIPKARQWRAEKFDAGFGWLRGPRRYGGRDLGPAEEAIFDTVEADYDVPSEDCFAPGLEFVGPVVVQYGSEELKDGLLRRLYRGDAIACQLFSEPEAGSDLAALRTTATSTGDGWIVRGQKVWTSRAHYSEVGLLLARTGPEEDRHRGITAFLVDMHWPGIDVRPLRQMTGDAPFNEVFFDEVVVPDTHRLGEANRGWDVAMSTLAKERAAISGSQRYRSGGLGDLASPAKLAGLLRSAGCADDPVRRQQWAALYCAFTTMNLTNARLAATPDAPPSSGTMGKILLARYMSAATELICNALGARIAADAGQAWAARWLPLVLGVPGLHLGGGTDEVILNGLGERALGLPRSR